ncbi:uncharacterized protein rab44 [Pempheris klunzingeri]|uniref:uncharacterized protein rab44 n=1 Tax=Pempheris klunzingeri TaxID=3127111 RepID=UPI00397F760E
MSITANVPEQEEAFHVQNTEVLSCDKDSLGQEMNMQLTNDAIETVGPQLCGQDEVGEKLQDSTKKDHEAQEINASQGDPFSASHNKNDTLAPCDTGLEENFRAEQAADVTEESGLSTAVTACTSQLGTEESADLQEKSKQKRRKMGSTRRTLSGKPEGGKDNKDETKESDFNIEANVRKLEKMEIVEELPMKKRTSQSLCYEKQLKTNETSSGDNKGQTQQSCTSDLQSIQSNMSDIDELKAFPLEQSASYSEEVVNPVRFVQVTDARNTERNVDVSMESSQLDDLTGNEMHITSVQTLNTEDATKKGSFESSCGIKMSTENDEEKPESVNTIQDQGLKSDDAPVVAAADLEIVKSVIRGGAGEGYENDQASMQELNDVDDVAHNKNLEMNSASPNLNSPNRRRKMGSTRRSLGSRTQDLHQKQGVDNDATETAANVGDVKSECLSGIKENELQPYIKRSHSESQQREEKVFETVECSHTGESYFKPPARQTFEENPVSHGQLIETEPQLTPNYLPAIPRTSPKHDLMSESASGGRRRKLGSHRKSRGHQNNEDQTERGDKITETQKGRDVTSITDESTTTTTEEESLGLDKIAEVDESDKKPSSNISTSMLEKHSRPKSEKTSERVTPVQHPYAGIHLGQQSQKTYSLGETPTANSYNVLMIGDSSVGKTSFIERAQSGKFSLDLPASVGLDSSLWTVVVDGKPVVLRLWDTAGQERFHSLTRQIFHKAQAFLLMYDITSSQSFSAVSYWASCIQEGAAEDVTILLLGNKSDHAKRQVKTEQGATLATEYNFTFMECSAATGENVIQSLETVARMLSQKVDTTEEVLLLHKEPQQRKSSGCC